MEFHYFMAIFHEVVETKVDDEQGRFTRLIKFTKGAAKEMVKTCVQLSPEVGFKTRKRLLHLLYGDLHRLIAAYRNQIKNGLRYYLVILMLRSSSKTLIKYRAAMC